MVANVGVARLLEGSQDGAVLGLAGTALLCVAEAAGATGTVPGATSSSRGGACRPARPASG